MRPLSAACLSLLAGTIVAVTMRPATAQHSASAPLTKADAGRTVTVPRGTVVSVTLNRATGTGYAWRYAGKDGVLPVDARTTDATPGVPGGPAAQLFQFRVTGPRASVAFSLARPWEKDRPPVKTVRYAFEVK